MNIVYLLLGSNLSDRARMLELARRGIEKHLGKIIKASSIYETEPWGFNSDNNFLNQVLSVSTLFTPQELLKIILNLEKVLGRKRNDTQYTSRTIDIDILFYNDQIINGKDLTIPHPRIQERMFTLVPLKEMDENLVHPSCHKTIAQLFRECKDEIKVELYGQEIKS